MAQSLIFVFAMSAAAAEPLGGGKSKYSVQPMSGQYMSIEVERLGAFYQAKIFASSSETKERKLIFETVSELPKPELQASLTALGFHERDLLDAFAVAEGRAVNAPHQLFEERARQGASE